jgi:hypothetical protein
VIILAGPFYLCRVFRIDSAAVVTALPQLVEVSQKKKKKKRKKKKGFLLV